MRSEVTYGRSQLIGLGARALEISGRAADRRDSLDHAGQGAGRKVRNGLGGGDGRESSKNNCVLHDDWND